MDTVTRQGKGARPARFALLLAAALGSGPALAQLPPMIGSPISIPGVDPGDTPGHLLLPGVRASVTATSNIGLQPSADARDGFIFEASPYVYGRVNTARTQAQAYLSLRSFVRSGEDDTWLRPDLRGQFNHLFRGDTFGIAGDASVYSFAQDPFGVQSIDAATRPRANTAEYRTLALTPYVQGRFGSLADWRGEYSYRTTDTSSDQLLTQAQHTLQGHVVSGDRFAYWGWSLAGRMNRYEYDGGTSLDRRYSQARAWYLPIPELRIGGALTYEQIDRLVYDGKDYGVGPGAFFDWAPTSRTSVRGEFNDAYYGNNARLSLNHLIEHFTLGLSYTRSVLSSTDASMLTFDAANLFSGGGLSNPIYQQLVIDNLLAGYGIPDGAGVVTDGLVRSETLRAVFGWRGASNSLFMTVYRTDRDTLLDATVAGDVGIRGAGTPVDTTLVGYTEDRGLTGTWQWRLGAHSSVNLSWRQTQLTNNAPYRKTRLRTLLLSYDTRLTRDTTALVGVRRAIQDSEGAASADYNENAIYGAIDWRF